MSRGSGLRLLAMGGLLFFLELLLFRVLNYLTHYLQSMLLIGYALTGVALGGLAARREVEEKPAFCISLAGTYLGLFLALFKLLRMPSLGPENLVLVLPFAFPAWYVAAAFRRHAEGTAYLLDMAGAGLAVLLLLALQALPLEQTLLATALGMGLSGLVTAWRLSKWRKTWLAGFVVLAGLAGWGLAEVERLDLFYLAVPHPELSAHKLFGQGYERVAKYDNLVSRVEVVKSFAQAAARYHYVNGGIEYDGFRPDYTVRYRRDPRLVGNLVQEPEIFIIGSSAQGILKTARYQTRPELIHACEINPAVDRILNHDFFKETGFASAGLKLEWGNALALLSGSPRRYDVITLMNCHSMGQMFLSGPPDWPHTLEAYRLYLSCLTPRGYLMVEERPLEAPGREVLWRRLATVYAALKQAGSADPTRHLFLYSWTWNREKQYREYMPKVFTSLVVKKQPLTPAEIERCEDWVRVTGFPWAAEGKRYRQATPAERGRSAIHFHHLPGVAQDPELAALFADLAQGRSNPRWDLSPVTDDRPFSSQVDRTYPEVRRILTSVLWLAGLLCLPVLASFRGCPQRGAHLRLHAHQWLAGAAYILVETTLMQLYQKCLMSAAVAFAAVLSCLLLFSALGGYRLGRPALRWPLVGGLALSLALHLWLAGHLLQLNCSEFLRVELVLLATATSGVLMGAFLPMGLRLARSRGLEAYNADYFASNALGGTVALALGLYVSIVWSLSAALGLGLGLYLLLALVCRE